jgi:hypothetical protein
MSSKCLQEFLIILPEFDLSPGPSPEGKGRKRKWGADLNLFLDDMSSKKG